MSRGSQWTAGRSYHKSERRKGSAYRRAHGVNKYPRTRATVLVDRARSRARDMKQCGIATHWQEERVAARRGRFGSRAPSPSPRPAASPIFPNLTTDEKKQNKHSIRMLVKKKGAKASRPYARPKPKRPVNVHGHGVNKHPQTLVDRQIAKRRSRARLQKVQQAENTWNSDHAIQYRSEAAELVWRALDPFEDTTIQSNLQKEKAAGWVIV